MHYNSLPTENLNQSILPHLLQLKHYITPTMPTLPPLEDTFPFSPSAASSSSLSTVNTLSPSICSCHQDSLPYDPHYPSMTTNLVYGPPTSSYIPYSIPVTTPPPLSPKAPLFPLPFLPIYLAFPIECPTNMHPADTNTPLAALLPAWTCKVLFDQLALTLAPITYTWSV